MKSHPWDDLEQRFLRFTISVKEQLRAISSILEDNRVPSDIADQAMNIATGAEAYIQACESDIADAMEQKISHDYKTSGFQQTTWTAMIGEDWTVQLPKQVVESLGWRTGDILMWKFNDDSTISVRKVD